MEEEKGCRAAIYARKSKFTGKGESIENQAELCRQYLALHYGKEAKDAAVVYEDEGFSGKDLCRPKFQEMMRDAGRGLFSLVVVYRLDRISRDIGDFAKLIQELNGYGIAFVSLREQFETASPMGRAMMYIASVFSQLERETIAERIRDNMRELAKTGRWLGGTTPTGYASRARETVEEDGRKRREYGLEPVPKEADMVRLLFEIFLETGSLARTLERLKAAGYRTKNEKELGRCAVKGILENPVYAAADRETLEYFQKRGARIFPGTGAFDGRGGLMVYNRTIQKRGVSHKERPVEEWIVAAGRHSPLVSGRDWTKAQKLLAGNRMRKPKSGQGSGSLLAGLLYCQECGRPMRAKLSGKPGPDGSRRFFYVCTGKEKSEGCSMANLPGKKADAAVLKALGGLAAERELLSQALEEELGLCRREDRRKEAKERAEDFAGQAETLWECLARTSDQQLQDQIMERIRVLENRKREMEKSFLRQIPESGVKAGEEPGLLLDFGKLLEQESLQWKRKAAASLVDRALWDGKAIQVYLKGACDSGMQNATDYDILKQECGGTALQGES